MLVLEWVTQSLPWFVVAATGYTIIWKDVHTAATLITLIIHSFIIYVLKETVRIDRIIIGYGIGHSLPSLHASSVVFLSTYYIYLFSDAEWPHKDKIIRITIVSMYAILVCISRVYLKYNTMLDVHIGVGTGVLCTICFVAFQQERIIKYD